MANVGNTPLIRKEINGLNVFIKDESKNPFGTYKDRRSYEILKEAKTKGITNLVLISSGNACYSLSKICKDSGIKVGCLIDNKLKKSIKRILKKNVEVLIQLNLKKRRLSEKQVIDSFRGKLNGKIIDVSRGFSKAYQNIIYEIQNYAPDYVIVPIGSGEAFVGLYQGLKKYKLKSQLVGVKVKNKDKSFADKLPTRYMPYEAKIKKILKKGNRIIFLDENEIKIAYSKFKKIVDCEPSAAVVFGAITKLEFKEDDKIILINSGKGIY